MIPLPIDPILPDLAEALRAHGAAVLVAPPGSGKTTRVPPALLRAGLADGGKICLLQPRRVAARLAAQRIAAEQGWTPGEEVGWRVRFEDRTSARTRIEVLTEGLLTRRLQADPLLEGVSVVILDEFHERSQHADLALALVRELRALGGPRLLVMSATLDPGPVARFLGGAPVLRAEGRAFPVEVRHAERPDDRPAHLQVAGAVRQALAEAPEGHVLAFLPGAGEIERCAGALADLDAPVLPLHGRLPAEAQDLALAPSRRRKVVLATNIAETSVTLEGVRVVIDSGLARAPRFDPARGVEALELGPISVASADQRAGRAGRTGPGLAIRLWTRHQHALRPPAEAPEVQRADLAELVLFLADQGQSCKEFPWFEPPPAAHLDQAAGLLRALGALDGEGQITAEGRALAALPLHPRLGRVVRAGHRAGALRAAAGLAALAAEPDPWGGGEGPGDVLDRLRAIDADPRARRLRQVRDQLVRVAEGALGPSRSAGPADLSTLADALLAGFPDRVGLLRGRDGEALLSSGAGCRVDRPERLGGAAAFVAVELAADPRGLVARLAVPVDPADLPATPVRALRWDPAREAVIDVEELRFGALVLRQRPAGGPSDPAAVAALLLEHARKRADLLLRPRDGAAGLLGRLRFLSRRRPDLGLPDPGNPASLLPELCDGRRSFQDLREVDLGAELRARLDAASLRRLDELAPARWRLPSGREVELDYGDGEGPPVLAARIQQLFGLVQHPVIAGERALVHLLAPNHRPAQVTADLPGFWAGSYAEVRKELRGRYPRHTWPEDPRVALPEDRPPPRGVTRSS